MAAIVWDMVPKEGRCICLPGEEAWKDVGEDGQDDEVSERSACRRRGQGAEREVHGKGQKHERTGDRPVTRDEDVEDMEDTGIVFDYIAVRKLDFQMYRVW
jgi:hypothetical protein